MFLKDIISSTDPKSLEEDGVKITSGQLSSILRDFYDYLRYFYSLRGGISKNGVFNVPFKKDRGSYFPNVEPNNVLMIDNIRFNLNEVNEITFYYTSAEWIDIALLFNDNTHVMMTFSPMNDARDDIKKYLGLEQTT